MKDEPSSRRQVLLTQELQRRGTCCTLSEQQSKAGVLLFVMRHQTFSITNAMEPEVVATPAEPLDC